MMFYPTKMVRLHHVGMNSVMGINNDHTYTHKTKNRAGYQNPVPFVLLILIWNAQDFCSESTGFYSVSERHTVPT